MSGETPEPRGWSGSVGVTSPYPHVPISFEPFRCELDRKIPKIAIYSSSDQLRTLQMRAESKEVEI